MFFISIQKEKKTQNNFVNPHGHIDTHKLSNISKNMLEDCFDSTICHPNTFKVVETNEFELGFGGNLRQTIDIKECNIMYGTPPT